MTQWDFTAKHEGIVPHLYLDTRGNLTAAVGFLVPDLATLRRLPWRPNVQAAEADWHAVKAAEPGKLPAYYRKLCKARLSDADMRRLFDLHVAELRRALATPWRLANQPTCVQVALVDMAFNLGVAGLNMYRKLHAAVIARQWAIAAAECSRRGIGPARNAATQALFLAAVDES